MATDEATYDIAIIGGGLAGLTLAVLLGKQGWCVACIDRETPETQTDKAYDIRTTAISWGSRNLLINAGIWPHLAPLSQPITDILILDEESPVSLEFNNMDVDGEAFGWIVDNRDIRRTLFATVAGCDAVTHLTGLSVTNIDRSDSNAIGLTLSDGRRVSTRLAIGADGRQSTTREAMEIGTWSRDYGQSAVVCLITHEKPHNGLAIEHFRAQGPFAALPYTDDADGRHRSAIVWTVAREQAERWVACPKSTFELAMQERLGDRFGAVSLCGGRAAWPLTLVKSYDYIRPRMALVAEAAHGMHPIAGQGLNMSLRDIAKLTELLSTADDPGDEALLRSYQAARRADNLGMVAATDILNDLFGNTLPPVRAARRFGLHMVSRIPAARKFFMRQAMGAVGHLPALIREAGR